MKCFNMDESHSFADFREIIAKMRQECPWDRAQTLSSLLPCLFDEMAETAAGVHLYEKTGDAENLCEELGDLLMVILLESRIAEEKGLFSLEDVIEGISRKMIRRHPHVFGCGFVDEKGELVRKWDEIKRLEKAGKTEEQILRGKEAVRAAEEEIGGYFAQEKEIPQSSVRGIGYLSV